MCINKILCYLSSSLTELIYNIVDTLDFLKNRGGSMPDEKIHIAVGGAAGNDHKNPHGPGATNYQDSASLIFNGEIPIGAVICDGCGSMPHSEIGAQFASKRLAELISGDLADNGCVDLEKVCTQFIAMVEQAAMLYKTGNEAIEKVIAEYFLFTVLLAYEQNGEIVIAGCGDGMYMADDEIFVIEPPLKNAPPYLSYRLIPSQYCGQADILTIREIARIPISSVRKSVIIGSDGLIELARARTDDLHHPAFMIEETRLSMWLQGQVFGQQEVYLDDDLTAVIIRSETAQAILLEERSEINLLKQKIRELQDELADKEADIDELRFVNGNLAHQVSTLQADLQIAKTPTWGTVYNYLNPWGGYGAYTAPKPAVTEQNYAQKLTVKDAAVSDNPKKIS